MPNSAAPSAATCTCEIAASAPVGITPVLRRATQARNPSTNSGTIGGRLPAVSWPAIRLRDADGRDDGRQQQHPGQLDDDGDRHDGGPPGAGGRDDLTDLVDAGPGPDAELQVAEPQRAPASSGSSTMASGAEEGDHRDPDRDVLLVGPGGVLHRGDGRGPADGEPGADQQAPGRTELHPVPEPGGHDQRDHQGAGDQCRPSRRPAP